MEMSAIPPNTPKLSAEEEEGALAPQELEILSGISTEAYKILKEPEDRDLWSLEDGDDSVFYSDEEQAQLNIVTASTASTGVKCRHLANTVTDEPSQQREEKAGEGHEANIAKENFDMGREMTHLITWTQEEEPQTFHTAKAKLMFALDSWEQGADSEPTPGEFMRTCKEFVQPYWTTVEMQAHPEQNASAEANRQVKEEEVELEAYTPDLSSFDVPNEEGYARLKSEANYPDQLFGAEGQKTGDGLLQVDQKAEQGQNFNVHAGLHQNPHPGYSSLPLVKKSGCSESHQDSFNHLTSTKYSTVSYRRIRRGNTRQKIDEFEYIINH